MTDTIQKAFTAVDGLKKKADVHSAFGKPVVAEGRTLIPVAEIGYTFELDFAASEDAADGAADTGAFGAVQARPMGVVEVTAQGVHVEPLADEEKITLALLVLAAWLVFWTARTLVRIFAR